MRRENAVVWRVCSVKLEARVGGGAVGGESGGRKCCQGVGGAGGWVSSWQGGRGGWMRVARWVGEHLRRGRVRVWMGFGWVLFGGGDMLGSMDAMHVILGLMAAGGMGGMVWVLLNRGELVSRVARSEEKVAGAEARLAEVSAREQAMRGELEQAADRIGDLSVEVEGYRQRLEALQAQHQAAVKSLAEGFDLQLAGEKKAIAARETEMTRREEELRQMLKDASEREAQRAEQMKAAFAALASSTLRESTSEFLKLAGEKFGAVQQESVAALEARKREVERLVLPIAETLKRADEKLGALEKQRAQSEGELRAQMEAMGRAGVELRSETQKLVKALREPQVRGRYGEVQLKRVAELAGMRGYCDFVEQSQTVDAEGNAKRPDMIVRLPNGRELVVDAKANLKPYVDAMEAGNPEEVEACLRRFADGVVSQAKKLSAKGYFAEYEGSADFVVMFMPGDQFVDAALSRRPELLDVAASHNVIIASPSSLIAMLRAVAVGFREASLAEKAEELFSLGRELHERAATAMEHAGRIGKAIEAAAKSYNDFIGSYESRLRPTLEKFEEAGVKGVKALPAVKVVSEGVGRMAGSK